MPGIAGIIDFKNDSNTIEKSLKKMADNFSRVSPLMEETRICNNAALGVVRLKDYPDQGIISEDKNSVLSFWGYIWGMADSEKTNNISVSMTNNKSAGQLLLDVYNNEGLNGLYKLNGRFVIALWDKAKKVLRLISDKYGFCKLFYWVSSNRLVFASEYKAIICHEEFKSEIDVLAVSDFMSLGYCLGDNTFLRNVKLLPPASVLTFCSGRDISIERYWDYDFHNDNDAVYLESDYMRQFIDCLGNAIKRQIKNNNNLCLPISGGLDSRMLAGMFNKLNFKENVNCFSYGHTRCFDVVYGRKIAKNLGYEHSFIPIKDTYLANNAEHFVWLTEGLVDCLNSHMLSTYSFIRRNNIEVIATGFLGDVLCGSLIFSKVIIGNNNDEDIIHHLYDKHTNIMKDKDKAFYLWPRIYDTVKGTTLEKIRKSYFGCPSPNRYHRSRYFALHERQRRYTSFNLYIFDYITKVVSPFLDYSFLKFSLHVPATLQLLQNLYKKVIVEYLPKVASVPWNETKLPLNASWIRKGFQWRWQRLNRHPFIRTTIGRRYAGMNDNYLNTGEAIRNGSRDFVTKHIKDNPFLAEYFNMDRVHQMLDNHMNGKADEHSKITALLTLSLWHKLFIEREGFKSFSSQLNLP